MKHKRTIVCPGYAAQPPRLLETALTGRSVSSKFVNERKYLADFDTPAPKLNRQERRALKRYNKAIK